VEGTDDDTEACCRGTNGGVEGPGVRVGSSPATASRQVHAGGFAMTMTTEQLLQRQFEAERRHEIEAFKRWMATATKEMQVRCPDCGLSMSDKWVE
jgi:hypothetical protein